jgi:hypothetical protein
VKRFIELLPEEMFSLRRPAPEPITFRFDAEPDARDLAMCRGIREREELWARWKRRAAVELAEVIAKHCRWFDASSPINGPSVRLEVTLHDRGQYERWLPVERAQGRNEGDARAVKRLTDSLPHGLADAATEFYE